MGIHSHVLLAVLVFVNVVTSSVALPGTYGRAANVIDRKSQPLSPSFGIDSLNRSSFPAGFIFGAASAAYQIEGGASEGGRGPSIWDTFTHKYPQKIADRSNGDVAIDSYHRYKEDVNIIKGMDLDSYRFSISWSRVLPLGKLSGGVNEEGIQYYNNLINDLLAKGLLPYVTLFHWDMPQALEDEYGGFRSPQIVYDFRDYSELCFKRFGDRVKFWTTLNEPWSFSQGYDNGAYAPGRCSAWLQNNCSGGDSAREPYLVTHYQLLGHAAVVKLYKEKYQVTLILKFYNTSQKGKIGITLVSTWLVAYSNSSLDGRAAVRGLDFMFGWFMDPLIYGDYPLTMRALVRNRLPKFTKEQSMMVKGSYDFIGLNYYTAQYAAHEPNSNTVNVSYSTDSRANLTSSKNGVLIGEQAGSSWLHVYPKGIWHLLLYIKRKYNNPPLYITENGIDEVNNATLTLKEALIDNFRIKYYNRHLAFVHQAIKDGANVKGYFAWSILDNFEWTAGYTVRFGIYYVDYKNELKRYPKLSAKWFKNFMKK
ncbi:beta-glucosidase 12-like [Cornus florida]|uniref:beta-glucosidase 12-like n=1 Tax=Cornus florida TaxID=4283 RepID=UPI00289C590E|nr:beta-glucosidase 12-like [Cornus florida]